MSASGLNASRLFATLREVLLLIASAVAALGRRDDAHVTLVTPAHSVVTTDDSL